MVQDIYIIDDENKTTSELKELFYNEKSFRFKNINTRDIEIALKNIPSLIIINEDTIRVDIIEICQQIRNNEDNSITPIIVQSSNDSKEHRLEVLKNSIEFYIRKPLDEQCLYYTIKNIIRLIYTNRRISPLTGLPGNVQIQTELKKRLFNKEEFSILYFDLDNFKAYNDVYGFLKGDEIIKFTARTILENVHSCDNNTFVGHIGGDDFVALIPNIDCESLCQDIILRFDIGIQKYFNEDDIKRKYLEVENRKGVIEQFPITSLSIGVVVVDKNRFHNILEIGEVGAQVKHLAKTTMGSTYVINRRKNI